MSVLLMMISVSLKEVQLLPLWLSVVKHISYRCSLLCSVWLQTALFAPFADHVRGENRELKAGGCVCGKRGVLNGVCTKTVLCNVY